MRVVFICPAVLVAALGLSACKADREPAVAHPMPGPTRFAERGPTLPPDAEPQLPVLPEEMALKQVILLNPNAFIPPQCYTQTTDLDGKTHNPCYTCHVGSRAPNFVDDGDVQLEYSFAAIARKNPWKNLFVDWTPAIAAISDDEITAYVRRSNYFDPEGQITLAAKLAAPPIAWDLNGDRAWGGYVPDARFAFDEQGFDREPDGGYTGWRAFSYYPRPGTFFPTNGSIGDALIRLPSAFRVTEAGDLDRRLYALNLAILESVVLQQDVAIDAVDERVYGVDLDQDGALARAQRVRFVAPPTDDAPSPMSFVGQARLEQVAGKVHLAPGLYPEGTEFLHSVRYLDPTADGVHIAARMKELRHARKTEWWSYARLRKRAAVDAVEKEDSPAEQRAIGGNIEIGVNNGMGWQLQGFIEDKAGELRPQTYEEGAYCVGCHGGVGATDDGIFSFSRKLPRGAFRDGWFHVSQRDLTRVPDRPLPEGGTEYVTYLERNGAGDEFRQNAEVRARFFDASGALKPAAKAQLKRDIASLLVPSPQRALALDKAYLSLVRQQSYRLGRDIVLDGARNVHRQTIEGLKTGVLEAVPGKPNPPSTPQRGATERRQNGTKSS